MVGPSVVNTWLILDMMAGSEAVILDTSPGSAVENAVAMAGSFEDTSVNVLSRLACQAWN